MREEDKRKESIGGEMWQVRKEMRKEYEEGGCIGGEKRKLVDYRVEEGEMNDNAGREEGSEGK